jgi:DNA-3-methyladenine glycosylase
VSLRTLLEGPAHEVAPSLLGCVLVTGVDGEETAATIVEVEAYDEDDPASHSHRGLTARNRSMFEGPGTLYVYRSYGIHWCANVVTGSHGRGAAVLLRAGLPLLGEDVMRRRRGRATDLCNGPGKLCQALGIRGDHDGVDLLAHGEVSLQEGSPLTWHATPRVGISRATRRRWRFVADG